MNLLFQRLRLLSRLLLIKVARDRTAIIAERSALIIAPHPDDETIGCGAVIVRARRGGSRVTVLLIGNGSGSHTEVAVDGDELSKVRRAELDEALTTLGAEPDSVVALDIPDSSFAEHIDQLTAAIGRVLRDVQPDDVYVTCAEELHPDHRVACLATARAVLAAGHSPTVFEYGVWLWSDWPVSKRFAHGAGVLRLLSIVLTRSAEIVQVLDVRSIKHRALSAHSSQLGETMLPSLVADYDPPAQSPALPLGVISRALDAPEIFFRASPRRLRSLAARQR
jgi:LmbE family N-acetylglucosaminyl deacetylase